MLKVVHNLRTLCSPHPSTANVRSVEQVSSYPANSSDSFTPVPGEDQVERSDRRSGSSLTTNSSQEWLLQRHKTGGR
jgi:hypothetical protein